MGLIPGSGGSPGEGNGGPLHFSCLENSMTQCFRLQWTGSQKGGHDWACSHQMFSGYYWSSIGAFELCWRRLLGVPWTARRSILSILKGISPEYSLERLMLKLKCQYFGRLMWRTDSLEKTLLLERLKAGGEEDGKGWDGWMASLTWWTWVWVNSGSWWWAGRPDVLQSMGFQTQTGLRAWTELNRSILCPDTLPSLLLIVWTLHSALIQICF